VDETVAGQVTIRWDATREGDGSDVNFSVTLTSSGAIRFHYGSGNGNLAPVIGISSGNGRAYWVSNYSSAASLANANSIEIAVTPGSGIVDLGAFEFRGSSGDSTAPTVTASIPDGVNSAGLLVGQFAEISLVFSEEINPVDANAAANYELRGDGANGIFGDADDDIYQVRPSYVPGSKTVKLSFSYPLPSDRYRLTVYGSRSVHDLAGLQFDGDANGAPGGDYQRIFTVDAAAPGGDWIGDQRKRAAALARGHHRHRVQYRGPGQRAGRGFHAEESEDRPDDGAGRVCGGVPHPERGAPAHERGDAPASRI
jgi:hypothetical protein